MSVHVRPIYKWLEFINICLTIKSVCKSGEEFLARFILCTIYSKFIYESFMNEVLCVCVCCLCSLKYWVVNMTNNWVQSLVKVKWRSLCRRQGRALEFGWELMFVSGKVHERWCHCTVKMAKSVLFLKYSVKCHSSTCVLLRLCLPLLHFVQKSH